MKLDIRRTVMNKPPAVYSMILVFATALGIKRNIKEKEESLRAGYEEWNRWLAKAKAIYPTVSEEQLAVILKEKLKDEEPWKTCFANEAKRAAGKGLPPCSQ